MISLVLFCVAICMYALWAYKVYLKGGHKLPPMYPGLLPIIGHLHLLVGDSLRLWRFVQEVAAECMKQGGVMCFVTGPSISYIISDPDDALTAANMCLQKSFAYDYVKPWLGDGLITASGETWKRHRKLLNPAFSLPVMYGFLDIFNNQSRKFVESMKQVVGKPCDHTLYLRNITLETFCLTSFGISSFDDKNFVEKYMHASDNIMSIATARFKNIWLQSDLIFRLTGLQKKQDEFVKIAHDMSDKIIQIKKQNMYKENGSATKATGIRYKAFLDLLLELSEENALTDKEIREEVDTAILTGFDTTSLLLVYLLVLLGTYHNVQEKVYDEYIWWIKSIFKTDRNVEKEDFQKLVYTEAVIKECLRFISGGPATLRYVEKDVKLKNYTMRAGSQCIILLYAVNRDPTWGKDVDEFCPERWLKPDILANPATFVGFSLGKRSCLGKSYAMISVTTMLVHFIRRYKISSDSSNLQISCDFLLKPVSGHHICIEERS